MVIKSYTNIFDWQPTQPQWWCTGFSGFLHDATIPQPDNLISVGTIDFTGKEELYEDLKSDVVLKDYEKSFIFDEAGHTAWIMWR